MEDQNYYQHRINKSLKYLNNHLTEEISISKLAEAAHFSSFHFQRLYKALQQETPYETILRLRLEKAAFLLRHYRGKKIKEVSQESGFSSIENFTRQFKKHFECSPSQFKKDPSLPLSRIDQEKSRGATEISREKWTDEDLPEVSVVIESQAKTKVVLKRALFGADGSGLIEAYEELMTWFESVQGDRRDSRRFGMSIDDPDITPANVYRYDFAVTYEGPVKPHKTLEQTEIPAGLYATAYCQGDLAKVGKVWDYLYRIWLPKSGYAPLHFPAIEEFIKGPEEIGWDQFDIKCSIPIKKIII